jgi:hypothetical protein
MNCPPAPLPTFFVPAGSKGGTAYATKARLRKVVIVRDFILLTIKQKRESQLSMDSDQFEKKVARIKRQSGMKVVRGSTCALAEGKRKTKAADGL